MTPTYLDGLNQKQKEAVTSNDKYLQILAGPGSGKTRVLTTRVAHLIKHCNICPTKILVVTFTNKASKGMRERLENDELLGVTLVSQLNIGTFHSVCAQYLRQHATLARLPKDFRILSPQDSLSILEKIVEERQGSITTQTRIEGQTLIGIAGEFQTTISKAKSEGLTAYSYAELNEADDIYPTTYDAIMIFYAYEQRLQLEHLVDFDDLLLYCRDLFEYHPEVAADIKHVLVDEFQDTNRVQYDIVYRLCSERKHLTIVGDPDQSIYGFRNANIANFKLMSKDFIDTKVINLEQNYRSTSAILDTAFQVIQKDPERIEKGLFTKNSKGTPLTLLHCKTEVDEGRAITAEISRIVKYSHGLVSYKDIAVLVRMHYLTQNMESIGGVRFFYRTEIQDLVSYIHFVYNPNDTISFERIINTPLRGVGEQILKKISILSRIQHKTALDVLKDLSSRDFSPGRPHILGYILPQETMQNIKNFVNLCTVVKTRMDNKDSVEDILDFIISESGYEAHLRKNYKDHDIRWENVGELVSVAHSHDTTLEDGTKKKVGDMDAFIARTALDPDGDDTSPKDMVQMMTIHAAKGLEWPCVFIAACEESIIPHMKSDNKNEERRLMYVAMTRAKCFLYGSYVYKRISWGSPKKTCLSPLLVELGEAFYQRRTPAWNKDSRTWVASVLHLPEPEEKIGDRDDDANVMDHPGEEFDDLGQHASQLTLSQEIFISEFLRQKMYRLPTVQAISFETTESQTISTLTPGSQTTGSQTTGSQTMTSQTPGPETPGLENQETQKLGASNGLKRDREYDNLDDYDFSDYNLTDDEHISDFEIGYDSDFGISDGDNQGCSISKKPREAVHGSS